MSRFPSRIGITLALLLSGLSLVIGAVTPANAASTAQVSSCDQSSLANAITAAGPGGTVQFTVDCPPSGPLRIGSTINLGADVTIDGNGHDVEMGHGSGDTSRFVINEGVEVTLKGLTIANNRVEWSGGSGELKGGAILNRGRLTVTDSTFRDNYADRIGGRGGAIANEGGQLFVVRSTFIDNQAAAMSTSDGGRIGGGGAIINSDDGTTTVAESTFRGNRTGTAGGAIYGEGNRISVTKSTFSENSIAPEQGTGTGFGGGAITMVAGDLTVTDSTFSGNRTAAEAGSGGAIFYDFSASTMTVTNSTFSGNTSPLGGGAIMSKVSGAISNSTFHENSSVEGAAVHGNEHLVIENSIFSGNTSVWGTLASAVAPSPGPSERGPRVTGSLLAANSYPSCRLASDNLASGTVADDSSCTGTATDGLAGSLNLGRLADNGGPTQTIALKAGSVAIDYPHATCLQPADQRGFSRGAKCDAGAYEAGSTGTAALPSCDIGGLYAALYNVGRGGTVRFVNDCSITLWDTVALAQDVTIDGNGHTVTFSGGDAVPVFLVERGVTAALNDLTVTGGRANGALPAGGVLNLGTLTVSNSTFRDNSCSCPGGGGITNNSSAVLTVSNSTFANNSGAGGGIGNAGTLTVTNSTFSRNPGVGGGISNVTGDGVTTLANTVFGGNGSACKNVPGAAFIDNGGNLADDTSCGFVSSSSTNGATGLQLGPLGENGGPTPTVALLAGSQAIDAAHANCPSTDQRHFLRGGAGQTVCDSGAFEFQVLVLKDVPANITTNAASATGAVVSYTAPTAVGGSEPAATCTPGSGSTFPIGITDVTCTATSHFTTPLTAKESFTVTVLDRTLSLIGLPDYAVTADRPDGKVVNYDVARALNLQGQPVTTAIVSCSPASGSIFPTGSTTVTCTATESEYANSPVSASGRVIVRKPAPVISGADPATRPAGSAASTLTLTGTGFVADSAVYLYPVSTGVAVKLPTRVDSFTQITADVPANLAGGTGLLSVGNQPGALSDNGGLDSDTWPWLVTSNAALASPPITARGDDPSVTIGGSGPSTAGSVTVSGTTFDRSSATLGVAKYTSNPEGTLPDTTNRYFNVLAVNREFPSFGGSGPDDPDELTINCFTADDDFASLCGRQPLAFDNVTIVACDLNGGKVVQWWTGREWLTASDQSHNGGTGCATITVGALTKPSLDQLTAMPFGVVTISNPRLQSITAGPPPNVANSANFTVTFDEEVSGVTAANFTLTTTGVIGASISAVSGTGATRTVSVNTGTGEGTVRLDMANGSGVVDASGNSLESGNLPFVGEVHTVKLPETTIGDTPSDPSSDGSATFTFSGPGSDVTRFECQLDAGFVPCTSPVSYRALGGGSHTFRVRAIDKWGNVGRPASFTWTIVGLPGITGANPTTGTAGGAASTLTLTGSGFAADSNVYLYVLDTGIGTKLPTRVVSSTELTADLPANLAEGATMLTVKNGGAGEFACCGNPSNHWPWPVSGNGVALAGTPSSATGPSPGASTGGEGPSTAGSVTVTGMLRDDNRYGTLGVARYASNPAGTLPASSGVYVHALVVRGFPESPLGAEFGPMDCFTAYGVGGGLCGGERSPAFRTVTIVHCDLRGGNQVQWWTGTEWKPTSHQTYNKDTGCVTVTVGTADSGPTSPRLEELARSPLGVTGTAPADTTPPDTTITASPPNLSNSTEATFSFTGDGTGSAVAGFECKLDAGDFSACTSPKTYSGLGGGSHTVQVRAIDAAGNVDPTPASFTWTIDIAPPGFTDNRAASRQGADGWLTGKGTGQSCPTGLADCVVVDLTVVTDPATALRDVGLTRDGVAVECSGGVVADGLTCQSRPVNSTTHTWTLTFVEDGIYRVEATGTATNGTATSSAREFKVDLHDPVSATATPTATSPETAGWFRDPVEVTFAGVDAPGGAGVSEIEYQLDGGPLRRAGSVGVDAEGVHTVTYRPVDLAGRLGPVSTLTVRLDRTAPAVACAVADGAWHGADVSIACTAGDTGSGLTPGTDAAFSLSTTVAAGTEPADAGTATRQVCDVAGNCSTAGPVGGNRVDKKAPTVTVASPAMDARYHLDQAVTGTYSCADGGSGLAAGSCRGTVPSGSAVDTSTIGRKELVVEAADNAGNAETVRVAYEVTRRTTAVDYDGPATGDYHDPVTVSARLADTSASPAASVSGVGLRFGLGVAGCQALTDASGRATCILTPDQVAGPASLQVAFDGNARFEPSSTSAPFTVTREQTTLAYGGPTAIANKGGVRLAATLQEEGVSAVADRQVTFTVGTGPAAQSCSGATNAAGNVECTISALDQPLGPGTVTAGFAGDGFYLPATASASTVLFEYLPQGAFVIAGDTAGQGRPVTFWGSQWAKDNAGPSSFKGYGPMTNPAPPACGGTWSSSGGNTSPPGALPAYMAVAVSGDVVKTGSDVGGPVTQVVVVRTDAGYTPDPSTPGTGVIVAKVCGP